MYPKNQLLEQPFPIMPKRRTDSICHQVKQCVVLNREELNQLMCQAIGLIIGRKVLAASLIIENCMTPSGYTLQTTVFIIENPQSSVAGLNPDEWRSLRCEIGEEDTNTNDMYGKIGTETTLSLLSKVLPFKVERIACEGNDRILIGTNKLTMTNQ